MFVNIEALGEKTLNKIATMAFSSQLEQVEKLSVQVKTDPSLLAKGMLESLAIDGWGLVTPQKLRMQKMSLKINQIAVSPWKALMGNIELTQPSVGRASIVFTEADLNRALNGHRDFEAKKITCQILPEGKLAIATTVFLSETSVTKEMVFTVTPRIKNSGKGVILDHLQYLQGEELPAPLTSQLLAKIQQILNLASLQMSGMSLVVDQLAVEAGKLTLDALAALTRFPTVN